MKTYVLLALMFLAGGSRGNDECIDTLPVDHHRSEHYFAAFPNNKEYLEFYNKPVTDLWPYCSMTCNELAKSGDGNGCYHAWTDLYCSVTPGVKVMDTCKVACKACCSDGIQNQGEEGVDCGGPCAPCKNKIDCKWSDWEHGQCSKTCGGGTRTNYRKELVHQSNGGKACSGSTWMTEDCNKQSCPPDYEFMHNGHCAEGWDNNNKRGRHTIHECYVECAKRPGIGYFAYSETGYTTPDGPVDCSCYRLANGCPDDELWSDFNSYRIIKK